MDTKKMTKQQLQELAAPVLDEEFANMIVSAIRYALPRHSYMPSLTRDYVKRHWPTISRMHWCILRDIREYVADAVRDGHLSGAFSYDLQEWIDFYNQMVAREDTHLDSYNAHLKEPINPTNNNYGE